MVAMPTMPINMPRRNSGRNQPIRGKKALKSEHPTPIASEIEIGCSKTDKSLIR